MEERNAQKEILEENNFYIYFFTFFVKVKIIFKSRCSLLLIQLTITSPAVESSAPVAHRILWPRHLKRGTHNQGLKHFSYFPVAALNSLYRQVCCQAGRGYTCKWVHLRRYPNKGNLTVHDFRFLSLKKSAFLVEFLGNNFRMSHNIQQVRVCLPAQIFQILPWLHGGPGCLLLNHFQCFIYHILF